MSCGRESAGPAAPTAVGRVAGLVTTLDGVAQPSLGRIFLMYSTGQQTGRYADVDPAGAFRFNDVPPGDWQIRFHAPGVAYVPEELPHPIRFSVVANQVTTVSVRVEFGQGEGDMMEIYVGDYFFQEQPYGKENAEAVVKLGKPVCWYNVGLGPHTVTGGPWVDSGRLERTGNYIWVPDRVGVFGYRCSVHPSQMIATLRVTA